RSTLRTVFIIRIRSLELLETKDRSRAGSTTLAQLLRRAEISKINDMQERALSEIRSGSHLLIVAPTGSGKTEAALFPILESLGASDRGGSQVLYSTPLRALNRNPNDPTRRNATTTNSDAR